MVSRQSPSFAAIEFAAKLGLDTLVFLGATQQTVARAHDRRIRIIEPVFPYADETFGETHPNAVQKVRDFEQAVLETRSGQPWVRMHGENYRWQSFLLTRSLACYSHPESLAELETRVSRALEFADDIAFDGFGFNNYYACFCDRCSGLRQEAAREDTNRSDVQKIADVSARTLVEVHHRLHDHAKSVRPDTLVINHVWPKFLPDEYIGFRYKLDFCTQTISWFYPPEWRIERVEAEVASDQPLCPLHRHRRQTRAGSLTRTTV
ncbi:MAG: hypothetical protein CL902_02655 [Dehalococcoidia bacterium]|nr:hypothetical protein [Dehalococcoidia bacterium]